jgi:type I restriction enzyme M protein
MKLLLEANGKTNVLCTNSSRRFRQFKIDLYHIPKALIWFWQTLHLVLKSQTLHTLSKFDLGYKWTNHSNEYHKTKSVYPNQNAEILFIERCLQLLKEGGRMAIVLPNGNFENPSLEYLRYYIKLKAKILAIVNLPQETFIPFGTGVKTSLLFLEKDTPNKVKQYPIFLW